MGKEMTLGLGTALLAVSMAMGCGVERDLSLAQFGCVQGGPCDAGTATDSGPADAGTVDLKACRGVYDGFTTGTDPGSITGTLLDDGTFALTLRSARHTSGQLIRVKVQSDRTLALVSGADEFTGFFDNERCVASGSWLLNGFGGPWEISKE